LTFFKLLASTIEENRYLVKPLGAEMLQRFFEDVFEAGCSDSQKKNATIFDPALSTVW
jgi:hypothetical protein